MRFEAKTEAEAVEQAARELGIDAGRVRYRVVRDEKSFWGGRIVEIEVAEPERSEPPAPEPIAPVRVPDAGVLDAREPAPAAERFERDVLDERGERDETGPAAPSVGPGGPRRAP